MKRIYILSGLILVAASIFLLYNTGIISGRNTERRDFALPDTVGLNKIYMVNQKGQSLLLEKKNDSWLVNGKYEAHAGWLKQLLETVTRIRVKGRIPGKSANAVIRSLASEHVKVELYINGELEKVYFVGGSTQKYSGTYMWIEGSSTPFIVEIPGFTGELKPRFNLVENTWRSRKMFSYASEEIEEISVQYFHTPEMKGFSVLRKNDLYTVLDEKNIKINEPDTMMCRYFYSLFRDVHAESFGMALKDENPDSIRTNGPWAVIYLKSKRDHKKLNIYKRKINFQARQQTDLTGKPLAWDTERYYAWWEGNNTAMLIQDYVFGAILRNVTDFYAK